LSLTLVYYPLTEENKGIFNGLFIDLELPVPPWSGRLAIVIIAVSGTAERIGSRKGRVDLARPVEERDVDLRWSEDGLRPEEDVADDEGGRLGLPFSLFTWWNFSGITATDWDR